MSDQFPLMLATEKDAYSRLQQARSGEAHSVALTIRGWKCKTESALHDEVGAALQFPDYYGENWNAMDECITDLSWLPADRYLIVVTGVESLLLADDAALRIFLSVLADATGTWAGRGISFEVILSGDQAGLDRVSSVSAVAVQPGVGLDPIS